MDFKQNKIFHFLQFINVRGRTLTEKGELGMDWPTNPTSTLCRPSILGVYSIRKGASSSGRVTRGLIVSFLPFGSITSQEIRPAPASRKEIIRKQQN